MQDPLPLFQPSADSQDRFATVIADFRTVPSDAALMPPPLPSEWGSDPSPQPNESFVTAIAPSKSWPFRVRDFLWHSWDYAFGLVSVLAAMAAISVIPIVQFISLGYLLECSGRVSRSGRIRDGFIDLPKWSRVGTIVLGTWLVLLPVRFLASLAYNAYLMDDPGGFVSGAWRVAVIGIIALTIAHLLLAWTCGGRLGHFFWPVLLPLFGVYWLLVRVFPGPLLGLLVSRFWPSLAHDLARPLDISQWAPPALYARIRKLGLRRSYVLARDEVWDFTMGLGLWRYFMIGAKGYFAAVTWLVIPAILVIISHRVPEEGASGLFMFLGVIGLMITILYLPFLQTLLAAENRFAAAFRVGEVRKLFKRAPLAFFVSLLVTGAFAIPLYLLKIELTAREIAFLPNFVFMIFAFFPRILAGWAIGFAARKQKKGFFALRWIARALTIIVAFAYAIFVAFVAPLTSWNGAWSMLEQHAFLIPAPFVKF